jgi:hypothetical protein
VTARQCDPISVIRYRIAEVPTHPYAFRPSSWTNLFVLDGVCRAAALLSQTVRGLIADLTIYAAGKR